jgi:hypothetical protein
MHLYYMVSLGLVGGKVSGGWSVMRKRMFRYSISAGAGLMIFPVILLLKRLELDNLEL